MADIHLLRHDTFVVGKGISRHTYVGYDTVIQQYIHCHFLLPRDKEQQAHFHDAQWTAKGWWKGRPPSPTCHLSPADSLIFQKEGWFK